jgi:toxin ParE1/3/4
VALFTRSHRAEEDLIEIWTFIAQDNVGADEACGQLAEHPLMGPARPDLAAELRYFIVGSYLILYREAPAGVEIVRVVHGARHLPTLFNDV